MPPPTFLVGVPLGSSKRLCTGEFFIAGATAARLSLSPSPEAPGARVSMVFWTFLGFCDVNVAAAPGDTLDAAKRRREYWQSQQDWGPEYWFGSGSTGRGQRQCDPEKLEWASNTGVQSTGWRIWGEVAALRNWALGRASNAGNARNAPPVPSRGSEVAEPGLARLRQTGIGNAKAWIFNGQKPAFSHMPSDWFALFTHFRSGGFHICRICNSWNTGERKKKENGEMLNLSRKTIAFCY